MGHSEVPVDGWDVRQTEDEPRTLEQRAGAGAAAARQRATRADDLLHDHGDEKLDAAVKHPAWRHPEGNDENAASGREKSTTSVAQAAKPLGSGLNPTGEAHFGLLVSPTMLWALPLTLSYSPRPCSSGFD